MITDTMKNFVRYRGLHPNLDTAIDWMQYNNLSQLPNGKIVIDGENVFVNIMDADLRKSDDATFEIHHLYADLQIDIEGEEYWECSSDDIAESNFDVTNDIGFFSGSAYANGILGNGRFVIFFPGEPHKPSCQTTTCRHLRKAVFKIKIN